VDFHAMGAGLGGGELRFGAPSSGGRPSALLSFATLIAA
jgi:hypothetical protein